MSLNRASCGRSVARRVDVLKSALLDAARRIRAAAIGNDLQRVNRAVEQALLSWRLPDRVYRLALPSLLYDTGDLDHMQFVGAGDVEGKGAGVAAWEVADQREAPAGAHALLLHGLYVIPHWQGHGTGTRLLEFAQFWASVRGFDGIVLPAWRKSETFFRTRVFSSLTAEHAAVQDSLRLWRPSA